MITAMQEYGSAFLEGIKMNLIQFSSHPSVRKAWTQRLNQGGTLIEPEMMLAFKATLHANEQRFGDRRKKNEAELVAK